MDSKQKNENIGKVKIKQKRDWRYHIVVTYGIFQLGQKKEVGNHCSQVIFMLWLR
jgi:hypothetical protein